MLGIGVLGPIVLEVDGRRVEIPGALERGLLARLALEAGTAVTRDRLFDDLWGERLPRNAPGSIQTLVYRLRRSLGDTRAIRWTGTGYVLEAERRWVDVHRFEALLSEARTTKPRSPVAGAQLLREALSIWRGEALSGIDDLPFVRGQRTRLEASRLTALADRIEADLSAAKHSDVVPELEGLVSDNPLEERFWRHLMLAQYRGGSQAGALRSYERLRLGLRELGLSPSPATAQLQQDILRQEPSLLVHAPARAGGSGPKNRDGKRFVTVVAVNFRLPTPPLGEEPTGGDWLRSVDERFHSLVKESGGEVIGNVDGVACAEFDLPETAVEVVIQLQLAERHGPRGGQSLGVGLHVGTVESFGTSVYGAPLRVAAALARASHPGQVVLTAATKEIVADRISDASELIDLGDWHLPDMTGPAHVFELRHRELGPAYRRLRTGRPSSGGLPVPPNSFVGRDGDVAAVLVQINMNPLVTLTGVGGVGKTRLALEVAARAEVQMPDGVWFCDLSSVAIPDDVAGRIASCLGLRGASPLELEAAVCDWLRYTPALVILDNCEQIASAVSGTLAAVVCGNPSSRIIATSRVPLGTVGEQVIRIDPLPHDDRDDPAALRLLIDRASSAGAEIEPAHAGALKRIVDRVEGIPLAIELAARRLTSLMPEELAERLEDCLDVLGPSAGGATRQQTISGAVEWSFDLLSATNRAVFCSLSVFEGGWTLEAAERIASAISLTSNEVSRSMAELWDQSLVAIDRTVPGTARYRMLVPVREYAAQRLREMPEARDLKDSHASYFAELTERLAGMLNGPEEAVAIQGLEFEFDNIRAAFETLMNGGHWDRVGALFTSLVDELVLRERFEIARWANDVLEQIGELEHPARAVALGICANDALVEGRLEDARSLSAQSLSLERRLSSDPLWISRNVLAITSAAEQRIQDAYDLLDEMRQISETGGSAMAKAVALFDRALVASFTTDPGDGANAAQELVAFGDATGSPSIRAMGLVSAGRAMCLGAPEVTKAALNEAAALADSARSGLLAHQARRLVLEIETQQNEEVDARTALGKLLAELDSSEDLSQKLQTVLGMLGLLLRIDALPSAAMICEALSHTPLGTAASCRQARSAVRAKLSQEELIASAIKGSNLSPEQLVRLASAEVDRLISG